MESLENLNDLFIHELRDLYDAEKQLVTGLPLFAQAAKSEQLRRGFEQHLGETKEHVRRLEKVLSGLGATPGGKSCKAMAGLIAEAKETLAEDADPDVLDAALIVAAQKIEHYEIAGYGSVCTFGRVLHYDDAVGVLKRTMTEEENTDKKLTQVSERLNERRKRQISHRSDSSSAASDRNSFRCTSSTGSRNSRSQSNERRGVDRSMPLQRLLSSDATCG